MIDISGLPKGKVLRALFNNTTQNGMGYIASSLLMTDDEASAFTVVCLNFTFLYGKPLHVDISGDAFDGRLYDLHAGPGAAARAIGAIRS